MTDRPLVLLTNPIHPDAEAMLAAYVQPLTAPDPSAVTLRALIAEAEGLVVRVKLPDDLLDHAPRLRGIVRHGVGLDMIPVAAATARGIPVANLPGSNTQAVAEYVFAALLHLRRRLGRLDGTLRTDGWGAARALADDLSEIGGCTLGVFGLGEIGGRVARIAHHGFGMRVLGTSRSGSTLDGLVTAVDGGTLFAQSDAVVIACPLTDSTRGLIDAALIGRMRPGAVLVNVARGPVVDTAALAVALRAGAIAGAALDVFDVQPLLPDDPLRACPNLLLTPHVAGITRTSLRAMSVGAVEEMLRILRGERPKNLVNPEILSA
ncbi:NAD(P)-dependent oxidoreductase [uncultured Methylobacterium sp.]|uniref:NAD(P)-dependent oxidoreductase n=1 Tax=uncultured Methylobacterium sp. TaxID=157278 RepID=UPI0035CA5492